MRVDRPRPPPPEELRPPLAAAAPRLAGVERFGTSNDAGNAPMRGINARLGYVPDPPVVLVEKRLG